MTLDTKDYILLSQFKVWRFGYQSRRTRNEVLDNMLYNEYRRTPQEIWRKADECRAEAENNDLKAYFAEIADRFRTKTIFGQ